MAKRQPKAKRSVLPGWLSGFSDEEGTEGQILHVLSGWSLQISCVKMTENESVLSAKDADLNVEASG